MKDLNSSNSKFNSPQTTKDTSKISSNIPSRPGAKIPNYQKAKTRDLNIDVPNHTSFPNSLSQSQIFKTEEQGDDSIDEYMDGFSNNMTVETKLKKDSPRPDSSKIKRVYKP